MAAILKDRGVVRVSGPDAADFLNGILTCEVTTIGPGEARLGALLSPQGKILFDFLILNTDNGFILDCQRSQIPDLLKRLTMYKLRARAEIADESAGSTVIALWGGARPIVRDGPVYDDPRHAALGWRHVAKAGDEGTTLAGLGVSDAGPEAYDAWRIGLGIAQGGADYGSGEVFPHEACLDQLGGVSFTKGCYVGQEVVSRMEHRGTARSRILPFTASGGAIARGAGISAGGKTLGSVTSASGQLGLALIRLDRLEAALAQASKVHAGKTSVSFTQPDWARFAVPQATAS